VRHRFIIYRNLESVFEVVESSMPKWDAFIAVPALRVRGFWIISKWNQG